MRRGIVLLDKRPNLPPVWRAGIGLREKRPNRAREAAADIAHALGGRDAPRVVPGTADALAFLAVISLAGALEWIASQFRRK